MKRTQVIKGQELLDLNMNLLHAVGRAATSEPRCILVHFVGDESRPDEVDFSVVGKGITYDTGGLNIKMQLMEIMHGDKGGASSVLGAL